MPTSNTLYLWDSADTLFKESWDRQKSGLESFEAYIESLGYNLQTIDPLVYERAYEKVFKNGWMGLNLMPGFKETLSWTPNNIIFTTGNPEQIDWRAEKFLEKGLFDIRPFFKDIRSTFDFGNTNKKTEKMFSEIIAQEMENGYQTIVYADNKLENCEMFLAAGRGKNIRCYHINASASDLKKLSGNFYESADLFGLLKTEQSLN